jgi:histidyl-tRNA synthetase
VAKFQAIRGMHDVLPEATPTWQYLARCAREVLLTHGYREIRLPILELTELFECSIGAATDIVEKEMYTFTDRNGDSLTLRPEGTASCVRAGLEHGLFHNKTQRLWYCGPMFRHEKPQRGRLRQFHQIGVEAVGMAGPDIDAELILMCGMLWRRLGLTDARLELNSLGTAQCRNRYRERLVGYLQDHDQRLDEDSRRRLTSNPLRILDSKNPDLQDLIESAPKLEAYLDDQSREHFAQLCALLDDAGVDYLLNPRLVRGLDYYSKTVFEWTTDRLGAQGTLCAGGRYDGLVELFGGRPTPAVGFAVGVERLIELLERGDNSAAEGESGCDVVLITLGPAARARGVVLAAQLREAIPHLRLVVDFGTGNVKRQLKRAYDSNARICLVIGEQELAANCVTVRDLRQADQQANLAITNLNDHLRNLFSRGSV